jgi:hypothetical protein
MFNPLTLIPNPKTLAVGFLAGALLVGVPASLVVHKMDTAALEKVQLADAKAEVVATVKAAATTHTLDTQNGTAAVAEVKAQVQIVHDTQVITKEIPVYVTPAQDARSPCAVSVGLLRVLTAAQTGADPASLPSPAGATDDACTAVGLSDLAASLSGDFGAARANAEQLNALIAAVKANAQAISAP